MALVLIGLGSNLGDRLGNLRRAVAEIIERTGADLEAESRIYETAPWQMQAGAGAFLNAAIRLRTSASPYEFLRIIRDVEEELGRPERSGRNSGPYADRTVDIDILDWDGLVLNTPDLILPHPGIQDRRFVLEPLYDIAKDWVHPVLGKTATELLRECGGSCVDPLDERL